MFFLGSVNVLGVPVAYLLERYSRRDFLFNLLLATEKKKIEQLNAKLQELSYIDGLMGIANRLRFEDTFHPEWTRALRTQQPLSLLT